MKSHWFLLHRYGMEFWLPPRLVRGRVWQILHMVTGWWRWHASAVLVVEPVHSSHIFWACPPVRYISHLLMTGTPSMHGLQGVWGVYGLGDGSSTCDSHAGCLCRQQCGLHYGISRSRRLRDSQGHPRNRGGQSLRMGCVRFQWRLSWGRRGGFLQATSFRQVSLQLLYDSLADPQFPCLSR